MWHLLVKLEGLTLFEQSKLIESLKKREIRKLPINILITTISIILTPFIILVIPFLSSKKNNLINFTVTILLAVMFGAVHFLYCLIFPIVGILVTIRAAHNKLSQIVTTLREKQISRALINMLLTVSLLIAYMSALYFQSPVASPISLLLVSFTVLSFISFSSKNTQKPGPYHMNDNERMLLFNLSILNPLLFSLLPTSNLYLLAITLSALTPTVLITCTKVINIQMNTTKSLRPAPTAVLPEIFNANFRKDSSSAKQYI